MIKYQIVKKYRENLGGVKIYWPWSPFYYQVVRNVLSIVWSSITSSFFDQGYMFFMIIVATVLEIQKLFTVFVYLVTKWISIA